MELNWSTFALELVNFIVLVWILQHFLYRPVRDVVARRREEVRNTLRQAEARRGEAEAMETRYRDRLSDWEAEREKARQRLLAELAGERERRREALERELARQRKAASALDRQHLEEASRQAERDVLAAGTRFVSRLLSRLAGPELETRLIDMALADLPTLPADPRAHLAAGGVVRVTTAYPLPDARRGVIRAAVEALGGSDSRAWRFDEDPRLVAGLRIDTGGWALQANLHDELRFFAEAGHDGT